MPSDPSTSEACIRVCSPLTGPRTGYRTRGAFLVEVLAEIGHDAAQSGPGR